MEAEGQGFTNGHATWTSAMSSFMLSYLSNVVSSGERTSSGFKKVHYNSCAKAINEKFQIALNGEQIKNHLKTWSRRFAKINRIRKVSGIGWDEDSFTITMDEEHYNGYVKIRKKAKKRDSEEEGLIAAFKSVGDTLSSAIEKVATGDTDVPDDLFDSLINLPGFEQTHISLYFNYLVAHPHIARAFNKLPFDHKLIWARNFVSEKFPGV
ncbi:10A19I.15 [Zea mays]|uniref:10A19I.15 n=1 Tax=Zea mays TaxID=4577 RepID=A0A1D6GGE9_MAIZE|nr:10A19I.15 [Zea mays]